MSVERKVDSSIRDSGAHFVALQARIAEDLRPLRDALAKLNLQSSQFALSVAAALRPFESFQRSIDAWQEQFREFEPALRKAAEIWERMPEGTRKAQDLLAARGWYLGVWDHSLGETAEIIQLTDAGDVEALETWLEKRTRQKYDVSKGAILAAFPSRADILEQAFKAHELELYAVSIPTMLAQSDGIHLDLLEQHLFRRNNRRDLRKRIVSKLGTDEQSERLLALRPLFKLNALDAHVSEERWDAIGAEHDPLNRHAVLHGMTVHYASERNSLRAVALLDFLVWVQHELAGLAA